MAQLALAFEPSPRWVVVPKFNLVGAKLADGHYSRRTIGSPQFMPPGETVVLVSTDEQSVFGWWRPHANNPDGHKARNGLNGWTCSIFRRTGGGRASDLILEAEEMLRRHVACPCPQCRVSPCGPDGLLTYVWDSKVASVNPGYCFKMAGYHGAGKKHVCCAHMPQGSADWAEVAASQALALDWRFPMKPVKDKYLANCKHRRRAKGGNGLYWYCKDCQLIVPGPD